MVLNVVVKYEFKQNFGSRDMGQLVTPKRIFRLFLEKYHADFKVFLPEEGFSGTES